MARSSTGLRDQLLAAALRLFVQHGFRGTSLADIASDVGCSKASLLYHFANKEAILAELLLPVGNEAAALLVRLDALGARADAETTVRAFVDLILRYRREMKLLFDNVADVTSLAALDVGGIDGIEHRLTAALAGHSPDPHDQVAAFMALTGMFVTAAADLPYDDDTLREAMAAAALRALGRDRG
ncbi:hypothetical protein Ssi03_01460 [Sphaerisporangium siamense]|uniref:AcrR family transcriptional regulator n=1 Tax=Sphaerisporangium siamense TaxID=795645 RepID=A0A7W7DBT2_9ACTN|nr:TetR/AcrR family transcriptional regulator [Sphaerisporangium siamense]MBB4703684.1 AcrR family transcriptional regulator [Sphaerisporangium siamense]GII82156.1 hypothetical protein Ssi03_01460 [Sphaerisporangium siamense]